MYNMIDDISEILFSEEQIDSITTELGRCISEDYAGKKLLLVCVIKGSVMFMSELMKKISIPIEIDFLGAESYGSLTKSSGEVRITKDITTDVRGKHVIIVEDILDSGRTLSKLTEFIGIKDPESIEICTLLDKPERRDESLKGKINPKYIGSVVEDKFVVGFGLDFDQRYRNLPFIGVLSEEAVDRIRKEKVQKEGS